MKNIPLARPDIYPSDIRAAVRVLKSPYLSRGPISLAFEKAFAKYVDTRYAVVVNSGTSAMHLAVRALGIGEGDYVITTPMSFIASSHAIVFERAIPSFVDVESVTLMIDPNLVEKKILELKKKRKKVKAILAVDLFGNIADWERLRKIANTHHLALIEDSCEALGSRSGARMAGSFGDVSAFAFYPNKAITTGEGGMFLTNDKKIADLAKSMRNQGIAMGEVWGEYDKLGYNYHLSDVNCALGLSQLRRMRAIIQKRRELASEYTKQFAQKGLVNTPVEQKNAFTNPFVYVVHLPRKYNRQERDGLIRLLAKKGISARPYFPAIHLTSFYRKTFGYKRGDFPVTEHFADRAFAIPFFHALTKRDIAYIVYTINDAVERFDGRR